MATTMEEMNAGLRTAVMDRLDATPADDPKMAGYVAPKTIVSRAWDNPEMAKADALSQIDALRQAGDGLLASPDVHPTSQRFYDLCDSLKAMHASKSRDYGCPTGTDPLANIRNGAKFVGIPAWRGAMVRLSDKVTRLATFNATGTLSHEGVEDNLLDLASYALLSLLLYQEEQGDA